ncbi:Eisosome component PIL1-domain-containing protein [Phyllosticta paracitricarpa]|uniref:Eisosome component PIL1-domain-containing protein n=1 Tax=Phyllosticta paracitricarpa TaxID=2016321 RepID=A0ABR1NKT7_9PEZI
MAIFAYPPHPPPPPPPYNQPPAFLARAPSRSRSLTVLPVRARNRSLSIRSARNRDGSEGTPSSKPLPKHRFTITSLRGMQQPELSKRLYKLIKSENHAISAHETAGRERASIAAQLSEWGEATGDDAVSDISDKLGVLMAEIAEQEDLYAQGLQEYRGVLKQIRNTESSVQPSRDHKIKVSDEIAKLKYKEPQSTKIVQLEQELVRAEAQSLVAEAQLTNITRQKFKEAYSTHFAAVIERAEKQALLAKHARRLINLIDDSPIVPGESHPPYPSSNTPEAAREVLNDAEDELRSWRPNWEEVMSMAGGGRLGVGGLDTAAPPPQAQSEYGGPVRDNYSEVQGGSTVGTEVESDLHPALRSKGRTTSAESEKSRAQQNPPYPISEVDRERERLNANAVMI